MAKMPRKFPEKYLVVKHVRELKESHPLAFLTPDGTDEAALKRKATAVSWASGDYWYAKENKQKPEEFIFDNVPIEGFRITDAVSRSSTDNKVFRIFDPRGFSCEISSFNLFDIIENSVIDHGLVQGKFVWARDAQVNYLAMGDDPEYFESLKPKEDYTPQPGDHIMMPKSQGILMGKYYVSRITTRRVDAYSNTPYYPRHSGIYKEQMILAYDDKPFYIIDYGKAWRRYMMSRSLSKYTIVVEKQKVPNPELDPEIFGKPLFLHKTKEEQAAFSLTQEQMRDIYIETYYSDERSNNAFYLSKIDDIKKMEVIAEKQLLPKEL